MGDVVMTLPALAEVSREARCFDGEAPLKLCGGSANDRRLGQQASANLTNDAFERYAGKRSDMFENVPRSGVRAHFLDHLIGQILVAMVASIGVSDDELSTGNAGNRVTVPNVAGAGAER